MKRTLLCMLAAIAGIFFITCGNEPPEDFYEGTPEDDTAIAQLLSANAALTEVEDMFDPAGTRAYIAVTYPAVTFPVADSYFRADSPLVKQLIDSCALEMTHHVNARDFWYAKDTTCTVYLYDTFTVTSLYHWLKRYTGHYNKPIIDPQTLDTLGWQLDSMETDTTKGPGSFDGLAVEGIRQIFFEPDRDTIVEEADTTYPVADPRIWRLKRLTYGRYYLPDDGANLTDINMLVISSTARVDTVFAYISDTTFAGHAMNRLRHVDSLLTFAPGEMLTLYVESDSFQANCSATFFASCGDTRTFLPHVNTVRYTNGQGEIAVPTDTGIVNLSVGAFALNDYYYIKPAVEFTGSLWLVPIRVQ